MSTFDDGLVPLAAALRRGDVTPVEAAEHFLARIAEVDAGGGLDAEGGLGAFVEVTGERALERAVALGTAPDDPPPLWGVPLAEKDLTARAGVPTRYGSRAFLDYVPETSDPLADGLDRQGAVSLGKTNTPEFGMTGYTETAIAPPARNPWSPETGAGGSSGGAAVAVATGMLPAAPASDGGGSIRIPSATVGVVGLKPSRGRLPFASGLESPGALSTAGPIARGVEDAAYLLDALLGAAPHPYAVTAPGHGPFADAARRDPGPMRIGVTTVTPWDGWTDTTLHPANRAAYDEVIRVLTAAGHEVEELAWDPNAQLPPGGYPDMFSDLWRASAAGIPVPEEALDGLQPFTAWIVRRGRRLTAQRLVAAYQEAAVFERATIAAFAPYDAVLTPALAMEPQAIGWCTEAATPEETFARQCRYAPHTSFVNVAGLPAISVPVTVSPEQRPVSAQLIGRPGGEATIIALAARLEASRGPLPWPRERAL